MSNALAIAGVTAVLKNLLDNAVVDGSLAAALGGTVDVTCLPPDRAFPPEDADQNRINLFLFQVTHNQGWRNVGMPSRDSRGERITNPPLALDLHYLLSVNGADEFHAEILLGYAMQLLHDTPVLTRGAIRRTLQAPSPVSAAGVLPPVYATVAAAQLAEQAEQIKIVPQYLSTEEMSRFWSTLQTTYRMTVVYHVSVVLIETVGAAKAPLPVLMRGLQDSGLAVQGDLVPRLPTLEQVVPPNQQTAVGLGETVTLRGHHLGGANLLVLLSNPRLDAPVEIAPLAGPTDNDISFGVPNTPVDLPAGLYAVAVEVQRPGEAFTRESNSLSLIVAPRITSALPMNVARDAEGNAVLPLSCSPEVRPEQKVTLVIGNREVPATAHPNQTASLSFTVSQAEPGDYHLRLRVDGAESILVNRTVSPPAFDATQRVTIT